jgi:NodT family efflux transporter outer membrane factor (OMF) lipoprotein
MREIRVMAVLGAAVLVVGGCTVGPDYKAPEAKVPGKFASAGEKIATTQAASAVGASAQAAGTGVADLTQWWKSFGDPTLDSLVERAVAGNLDVRQAEARLREARARLGVSESRWYPTVDAGGQATRSRQSKNLNSSSGSGGSSVPGFSSKTERTLYEAGFDASWEIDVFGGVRRDVEASRADLAATAEDRRAVITSLLSEVALNYVLLRGTQQRIRIAEGNIASQRETLRLNEARFEAGITSEFDVARARAQVASFEATVPNLQTQARQAIHRLSVLTGQAPAALAEELSPSGAIPMALPEVPVGLPSELLMRRPDIRRAERQLAAATARIGVATADLFPRFSLTGSLGTQSDKVARMADSKSIFYSVGPAVSWNVFDAGRIRNNIRVQDEQAVAALAAYEQSVLSSLEEVENAIVAYTNNVIRREALRRAVEANRRSVELATGRFAGGQGVGNLLDVLVAQRDQFGSEEALVASETELSQNLVSLYKALGGGWETYADPVPPPSARPSPAPSVPATQPAGVAGAGM